MYPRPHCLALVLAPPGSLASPKSLWEDLDLPLNVRSIHLK
jgi:hypothetical protein